MAPSIGLNLRVTGYKHQGGRRYMEDDFGVAYQQTADEKDLEYAFFGIFDGHGGREAAAFAKEHLMDYIVSQKGFWEEDDDSVLKAIREGFIQTHYAMWKELEKWPKTAHGLPSTAGTTASIAFIRRGKIYIGHVGDSAIVLGVQDPDNPDVWIADPLTIDHKPESIEESERIIQSGGKVVCKSGVPRVVWNRPKMGHQGPVRRSTHIDEIPFLAVARSLGDLWSYNSEENVFVVSPEPDCRVYPVDISKHRCLVLATDGAWNMMTPQNSVSVVCKAEKSNEQHMLNPVEGKTCWINPSKMLVDTAIERWINSKLRADNTSVVTVMLDPPGPPRAQVLKNRQRELAELNSGRDVAGPSGINAGDRGSMALLTNTTAASVPRQVAAAAPPSVPGPSRGAAAPPPSTSPVPGPSCSPAPAVVPDEAAGNCDNVTGASSSSSTDNTSCSVPGSSSSEPQKHCTIISRFPNSSHPDQSAGYDLIKQRASYTTPQPSSPPPSSSTAQPPSPHHPKARVGGKLRDDTLILRKSSPMARRSSPVPASVSPATTRSSRPTVGLTTAKDDIVQCNEVSSSEDSPGTRSGQSTPPPPPGQESILPTSSSSKLVSNNTMTSTSKKSKSAARKSLCRELSSLHLVDSRTTRNSTSSKVSPIILSTRNTRATAKPPASTPKGNNTGGTTPTKNKMLHKPVLNKDQTKSLVQLRCIQITEKLEMAKSASTRSLSAKRLGVVTSATKTVSSSPSLRAVAKASPRQSRNKLNSPAVRKNTKPTPKSDSKRTTNENKSPALIKKVLVRNMKTPGQAETPKSARKKVAVKEVQSPANTTKLSKTLSQIRITDPSPKRVPRAKATTPRSTVKLSLAKASPKARGKVCTPVAERVLKLKKNVKTPQLSNKKTIAKVTPKVTPKRKIVEVVQPTPKSGVKRKVTQPSEDVTPAKITKTVASPVQKNKNTRKTPAKTPKAVSNKKPQVTRSKQATVLKLKK